jgi:hypothetical protein
MGAKMLAGWGMAAALVLGASQETKIEAEPLPSIEEVQFDVLTGDFDGDGKEDTATAHQTGSGVQVSLELSSEEELIIQDLGFAGLEEFTWSVTEDDTDCEAGAEEDAFSASAADEQAPLMPVEFEGSGDEASETEAVTGSAEDACPPARDLIEIRERGGDVFYLRWEGGSLEILFG